MSRRIPLGRTSLIFSYSPAFLMTLIASFMASGPSAWAQADSVTQSWQSLTSTAGNFRVSMPSTPAAFTFVPDSEGSSSPEMSELAVSDARVYLQMQLVGATRLEVYAVAFTAASDFLGPEDELNEALLRCVNSLSTQTVQATISTVRLAGEMGIEAESFSASEGLQVSRCYLAGDRAYLISATSKPFQAGAGLQPLREDLPTETRSPTMAAFLNSFEILD